jgi:hypothetical protein
MSKKPGQPNTVTEAMRIRAAALDMRELRPRRSIYTERPIRTFVLYDEKPGAAEVRGRGCGPHDMLTDQWLPTGWK